MKKFLIAALCLALSVSAANAQWHRGWGYHSYGNSGGLLGGLVGGVIGGVIGGAISRAPAPQYVPDAASVQWCVDHFRSYNPQTGFYVGYDNQFHRCP